MIPRARPEPVNILLENVIDIGKENLPAGNRGAGPRPADAKMIWETTQDDTC